MTMPSRLCFLPLYVRLLLLSMPASAQAQFQIAPSYPVGVDTYAAAAGDFNHDGYMDLVVTNVGIQESVAPTISILLANPDGTFQPAVNYPAGYIPYTVAVGDYNQDGNVDLIVGDETGFEIHLGNGDGTFQPAVFYEVDYGDVNADQVIAGDFNGDGKLDVMMLADGRLFFIAGNGDGTFQTKYTHQIPFPGYANAMVARDLNGDGIADLAVTDSTNDVAVLLGNGNGTFTLLAKYPVGYSPHSVVAADFNGDGKPDLAVLDCSIRTQSCNSLDDIAILLGNGDGTFQSATIIHSATDAAGLNIQTGDFNGDGKADLVVANYLGQDVSVLLGNGDGTFQATQNWSAGILSGFVSSFGYVQGGQVVTGDFNNDSKTDLAVVGTGSSSVTVLLGQGASGFAAARNFEAGYQPGFLWATGDLNGDGVPDLVGTNFNNAGSPQVFVMLGKGDGTFAPARNFPGTQGQVAVADLNGDGHPDVVVLNYEANGIGVLLGNGHGSLGHMTNYTSGVEPESMALGDFNGDGKIDAVVVNSGDTIHGWNITFLAGNGDGTFQPPTTIGTIRGFWVIAADFNGDGKLDLAVTSAVTSNVSQVAIFLGNGNGTFRKPVNYTVPGNGYFVTAGDLNGDGKIDLLAGGSGSPNDLAILFGNGDGTFQNAVTYAAGVYTTSAVIADLNGDGITDIAALNVGSSSNPTINILYGTGGGNFVAGPVMNLSASWILGADFNGDGKVDLAAFGADATILLNTSSSGHQR
jgi:hypothetical protein